MSWLYRTPPPDRAKCPLPYVSYDHLGSIWECDHCGIIWWVRPTGLFSIPAFVRMSDRRLRKLKRKGVL